MDTIANIYEDIEINDSSDHKVADLINNKVLFDTKEEAMAMGRMLDYTFKVRREYRKYRLMICTKYTDATDTPIAIGDKLYNLFWIYKGIVVDIKEFKSEIVVYYKYRARSDKVKCDYLRTWSGGSKRFFVGFNIKSVAYCISNLLSEITSFIHESYILRQVIIGSSFIVVGLVLLCLTHFIAGALF